MLASRSTSAFLGQTVSARPLMAVAPRRAFVVENAHKMGSGSTKNGRDSNPKRRGVKVYGGQEVQAGGIIIRQVGTQWYPGENAGLGRDFTIYSTTEGIVVFEKKDDRPKIHVYPKDHAKAIAAVTATHTKKAAEGQSRAERRKTQYTSRKTPVVSVATVAVPVRP